MKNTFSYLFLLVSLILSSCQSETKPLVTTDAVIDTEAATPAVARPKEERKNQDDRMTWQNPNFVIESLGNLEDKVIADIGAGIGYFSFKLLPKSKKVIAIEIDQDKIEIMNGFRNSLSEAQQAQFDIRLASDSGPGLNKAEVDLAFIVNTIAYLTPRVEYLTDLKDYLKPNGKVFIVDYKSKRLPTYINAPDYKDRVYMHTLEQQLEDAGYIDIKTDDTSLDFQYLITATVPVVGH